MSKKKSKKYQKHFTELLEQMRKYFLAGYEYFAALKSSQNSYSHAAANCDALILKVWMKNMVLDTKYSQGLS